MLAINMVIKVLKSCISKRLKYSSEQSRAKVISSVHFNEVHKEYEALGSHS